MDFTVAQCVDVSSTRNTSLLVDSVEEDDVAAHFFGFAKGNIVGIRYYAGMVNNKEMVALVREPANPYDRNAVRVNNIMGQQVGHIKREMARALAEVVDQGLASIEGVVPYGANNVYSMAVEISFWGAPENKERTSRIMAKYGFALMPYTQSYGKGNSSSQKKTSYESPHSRAQRLTSDQMKNELDGLFEKLRDVDQTVEEEACPAIKSNLYMHQKQAIAWMRKKETGDGLPPFWEEKKPTGKVAAKVNGQVVYYNSITNHMTVEKPTAIKGGILADDMGLGKTLITISLILGSSWNSKPIHGGERIDKVETDTELIIEEPAIIDLTCDGADIENVKEEIVEVKEEVTIESTDAITVTIPSTNKENIEVVTESAMENNLCRRSRRKTKRPVKYRDEIELSDDEKEKPKKQKKSTGGRTTQSSNVADKEYVPSQELASVIRSDEPVLKKAASEPVHYFVREPVPSDQPHTTLIICPLSLISNWVGQVEEHVHAGAEVKILVFHGPAKSQVTGKILMEQDIVITTYQTVAQELKRSTNTLLFKMKWLRVVLDEGHIIRNQKSQQSIACRTLKAERKWVLSGTPIQNSTKDLFAIVLFLGIDTFADLGWWQRTIQRPISNGDSDALKRIQCLLSLICIRRTKSQKVNGKPIVTMPGKDTFVQHIDLDSKERQMYEKMNAASKRMMKSYMESDSRSNGYADMLVYIMRLRQICCHPSLAKEALEGLMSGEMVSEKEKQLATKLLCMIEAGSLDDCCICLDSITSPVISRCSHVFCKLCIAGVVTTNGQNYLDPRCPLCRSILRQEDLVEPPMENEELDENVDYKKQPSSKVHALMHELLKLNKEDPSTKSLVVSQFTEFLKIIQQHLIDNNIPFVLYHGGMTRKAREEAIWQLQCGQAKVMLMTLKAGGVGLNLTAASQVFLMEPSWNPAAEDQCFDRVYRLGQTKSVRITKFICKNTVEERMVEMQSRKRELAKASLQRRTAAERKQQTVADLRRLMES